MIVFPKKLFLPSINIRARVGDILPDGQQQGFEGGVQDADYIA
jgi:hypothetical protein